MFWAGALLHQIKTETHNMPVFDVYDDKPPRRIMVSGKRITIGRTADNQVAVDDRQASRKHCEVRISGKYFVLHDLKSRNGVTLNQDLVYNPSALHNGDEIGIGSATIRFWYSKNHIKKNTPELPVIIKKSAANAEVEKLNASTVAASQPGDPDSTPHNIPPKKPHKKSRTIPDTPQKQTPAPKTPPENRPTSKKSYDTAPEKNLYIEEETTSLESLIEFSREELPEQPQQKEFTGRLNLQHIIPLNHEGRPAHPIDKGTTEISQAMLQLKEILLKSFHLASTDIHIEPKEKIISLRYRVDGYLHHVGNLKFPVARQIYSIIKLLCNLDINKRSVMLDGSFAVQLPDRRVDMRVSIAPSTLGDKMVIRILDRNLAPKGLDYIGMSPYVLEQVRQRAFQESSMIVICGPTGSGKTTTAYSIIREIDTQSKNVVTVEDPVEYKLDNVTQIQVNLHPKFNITFISALSSLLRQDPDVILVGEMRDKQTAQMAVQSAMTGHLVLSTVHARDSISCIFRLLDLGVEPFLIGSAINAVLSQRLLRALCPHCKMTYKPSIKELARNNIEELAGKELYSAIGCEKCMNIGYKGRAAIFELLAMTDQVRDAITSQPTIHQLRVAAGDWIFQTLREDALRKVRNGFTSLDEFSQVGMKE